MKALIISDKQEIIDSIKTFLSENNYDIIVYRWLLKALDNIEEIQPDLIILNACEYPRHWKTLASFVQSGIGGNSVKVYLYEPEPLNNDDKQKAEQLGIKGYIESLSVEQLEKMIDKPVEVEQHEDETTTIDVEIEEPEPSVETPEPAAEIPAPEAIETPAKVEFEIILTHPLTGKFIYGTAISYADSDEFNCEITEEYNFNPDSEIKFVSVFDSKDVKAFSAKVISCQKNQLKIKVIKYYEEEI